MAHLKKRFALSKKYQWYFQSIVNLRMKKTETVRDYYDRVQGLFSEAKHAIDEKYTQGHYPGTTREMSENTVMMKPVVDCALDSSIMKRNVYVSGHQKSSPRQNLARKSNTTIKFDHSTRKSEIRFTPLRKLGTENLTVEPQGHTPSPVSQKMIMFFWKQRTVNGS